MFEKLISIFCHDFLKGSTFFNKFRKFELNQQLITTQDPKIKSKSTQISVILNLSRLEQDKNIRNLYFRQFQLPLADIDVTWEQYSKWEKDPNELQKMKETYDKTYQTLEEVMEIEEKLQEALEEKTMEKILEFIEFLKGKTTLSSPKRLNYLERILAEYPYEEDLWRVYLDNVNAEIKIPSQMSKYYRRATKCLTEIGISRKYLRILSKLSADPAEFECYLLIIHFLF